VLKGAESPVRVERSRPVIMGCGSAVGDICSYREETG
jgi:hypothetical protein